MVAEERLRIAHEVHDVIAHAMVAINVQAGLAAHVLDRRPEQTRRALKAIKDASNVALADLAETLGVLRDDGAAAPDALTRQCDGTLAVTGLAADLDPVLGAQQRREARPDHHLVVRQQDPDAHHSGSTA